MTTLMKAKPKSNNGMMSIFDHFFDDDLFTLDIPSRTNMPEYDIIENDDNYVLNLMLAGFKKEDVSLNIDEDILNIEGERKVDEKIKFSRKGSYYGKFKKSFTLPDGISKDKIDASFTDGVLSIMIPKSESTKLSKSIEIK